MSVKDVNRLCMESYVYICSSHDSIENLFYVNPQLPNAGRVRKRYQKPFFASPALVKPGAFTLFGYITSVGRNRGIGIKNTQEIFSSCLKG